jgi:PAS domain S-box-containing protein
VIILIGALMVPTIVLAVLMMVRLGAAERQQSETERLSFARGLSAQIDRQLITAQAALAALTTSSDLKNRNFAAFYQQCARVARQHDARIVLADVEGRPIFNTVHPFGATLPTLAHGDIVRRAAATRHAQISELFRGGTTGDYLVSVFLPVIEETKAEFVLILAMRAENLSRIFAEQHVPPEWTVAVVDQKGNFVGRNRGIDRLIGRPVTGDLKSAIDARLEGLASLRTKDGDEVYTAFTRSALSGWTVAYGIPRSTVDAPLFASLVEIGCGSLVLLLVGGLVALWSARRIARSTQALSRAALALGGGDKVGPVETGITEMDAVMASIDSAAVSLGKRASERDRAEAALRESEKRLRNFAETASDWYWETDPEHRFTSMSEHLLGSGEEDPNVFIGKTRREIAADRDSEFEKWREYEALLDRHEPFRGFVYTMRLGQEAERTFSISGTPVFDDANRFLGYRGTARDIGEEILARRLLREAKVAAEAANLAKSQFLANTSHELRTPLNAILGFSEVLASGLAGSLAPRQEEYVGLIHQSGEHLLNVIEDILDLARIEVGKLALHEQQRLEPGELAQSCLALVRERANAHMLHLALETEPGLPQIVADPTRLKQILLNLLSNAIKFTEAGGAVTLAIRATAEGGIAFTIADTGVGMTPAQLQTALEPFGQVESGLTRRHDGTGLGLPLAVQLTELHGGTLRLDSLRGRGTKATVTLPKERVAEPATTPLPAQRGPAAQIPDARPVALLVDDDPEVCEMIAAILAESGWRTIATESFAAAMAVIDDTAALDALISDIMIPPGPDGIELAQRARRRRPDLPILLLSGYGAAAARSAVKAPDGAAPAAWPILAKPFGATDLAAALEDAMHRAAA